MSSEIKREKTMTFSYKLGNNESLYGDFKGNFSGFQNYLPLYEKFFLLNDENYNKITVNNQNSIVQMMKEINQNIYICRVKNQETTVPVFFKYSPLLDPVKYMGGEEKVYELPTLNQNSSENSSCDPYNVAYVDGFFYFLSSKLLETHNFVNGNLFYGQHLTYKKKLEVDIGDDLEYLAGKEYFNRHKEEYDISEEYYQFVETFASVKNKRRLRIENNEENGVGVGVELPVLNIENYEHLTEIDEVFNVSDKNENNETTTKTIHANVEQTNLVFESALVLNKNNKDDKSMTKSSSSSYDSNSEDDSESEDDESEHDESEDDGSGSEDDGSEDDGSESEDDKMPKITAKLANFPVNMIGLECYVDTLDEHIFEGDVTEDEFACILLQIIFTLIGYQKAFSFVHNDLHTSNIMFIPTENDYIFYKYKGEYYKVKTYGKLWKIIDYGRATYKFNGQTMFSSSFNSKGDAATQYNCEPYYNPKKKPVDVNYSFDLCRLACSLYEDLFDDEVVDREDLNPVENVILDWCLDYKGRNVLIKNNGEERYEGFKLYKMIARTVHAHVPEAQLSRDIFKKYITKNTKTKKGKKKTVVDIDSIPDYSKSQENW